MTKRQDEERSLADALRAIADGVPPTWDELETTDPAQAESLHLLDDVARAYRANFGTAPAAERDVLFRWGGLEVEERLGTGSFGEVYRAFDPWLGRRVALKLFRAAGSGGLDEARRLARLRHRNVLSVYGCGVHDQRAGLWSELIEGRTLADALAADGTFGRDEALRIGRDLAQALAAVHAAGLVHGDVKAENVMRESGGRIVLMDFGAGGDERLLASQRIISGTPRYLPPEVLDGAPLSAASDIYALGVLLFFLLSGRLPYAAADARVLREEQRCGERPRLRDLRPDLDEPLRTIVERCIANDPAQRPADAASLCASLGALLAPPARSGRSLSIVALVAACAALIATGLMLSSWFTPPVWESRVRFLRVEAVGDVGLTANSTLNVGDRLRLELMSSRDTWVYVLNEDAVGNATVLFPLEDTATNPQRGGRTLMLPGGADSALTWEVTAESTYEEFVVIESLAPLTEVERDLDRWKRARPAGDERTVGATVKAPALQLRGDHLRHILSQLTRDTAQVRVAQYRFAHRT